MIEAHYIAHSGDDLLVVNAARVSFAKRSDWARAGWEPAEAGGFEHHEKALSDRDVKLIGFLARNGHWTPFAHPQITLHIKAPIFVARQCFKHKIGFVENEVSRRYVDEEPAYFMPYFRERAPEKKQGSGDAVSAGVQDDASTVTTLAALYAETAYKKLLGMNIAPEQARMVLPQSMMTEWFWTGSLAAWARFCGQRMGKDAQAETGDVARAAAAIIEPLFPVSWAALTA